MREVELKIVVDDDFEIRPERIVIPGALLSGRHGRWVHDTYFDTADLRLARWGVTLRWRDGDGWNVKIPRPSAKPQVLDRDEVHVDGDPGLPPPDALALIASFARHEPLIEVATIDTQRTARIWSVPGGASVGELVDDRVVAAASTGTVRFREIEFELAKEADPAHLQTVADALGLDDSPAIPKLVRVLGDAAAAPPDVVVPDLPEHPSAADVVHAAIAASVHRLLVHVPAAWLGTDPEGVHQARVASRRLRSDLRTFAPLLEKTWAKKLRRELGWLAAELGKVRDADVLDGYIATALAADPLIDPDAGAEIRACLEAQRVQDRTALVGHLADVRAVQLFEHLVDAAATPRTRRRARKPGDQTLPPLVQSAWAHLTSGVADLGPCPTDDQLHEIRILTKRVRYAAEAVAPALGKEAKKFGKAAGRIQEALGDLHDSAVAAEWLEQAAASILTPRAASAAIRLAERLRVDAAPDRTDWQPSFDKMRRRSGWLG